MNGGGEGNRIRRNQKLFVGDSTLHVPIGSEIGARNRGVEGSVPYDAKKKKGRTQFVPTELEEDFSK